jgi:transposase
MAPSNRTDPQRSKSGNAYTLHEFVRDFPDDETCLVWLWNTRFNLGADTAWCTRCEAERPFKRYKTKQQRQDWTCTACGLHVHPTADTIYHKSSTPLHKWFYAMYLMTSTRCGVSAKQLQRELGVTYKTAWRMFTLIRNELMEQDPDDVLDRPTEMDETYWGGKPRATDRAKWTSPTRTKVAQAQSWAADKKTPIFGMVERNRRLYEDGKSKPTIIEHGHVAAWVAPRTELHAVISEKVADRVKPGTTLYTDDSRLYDRVTISGDLTRHKIAHSRGRYTSDDGAVHTQQIEGFWSLLKRGLHGAHHSVSPKWMQGYVNEYVWRYNHGADGREMFAALLLRSAFPVSRG